MRIRFSTVSNIGTLLMVLMLVVACDSKDLEISNMPGKVGALGPLVTQDDGTWDLSISVYDYEGDPVNATIEFADNQGAWQALSACAASSTPCLRTLARGLSTHIDARAKLHHIIIDPGQRDIDSTRIRAYVDDADDHVVWPAP